MSNKMLRFSMLALIFTASCAKTSGHDYELERKRYSEIICSNGTRELLLKALSDMPVQAYERKEKRLINAVFHFDSEDKLVSQSITIAAEYNAANEVVLCEVKLVATGP